MAKYTITRSCGHKEEHQLFGKMDERARRIKGMERDNCSDCRAVANDAENAENAEVNKFNGLLPLRGSPKQIAWAETIRKEQIQKAADELSAILDMGHKQVENGKMSEADYQEAASKYNATFARLTNETDARIWIDSRRDDGRALLRAYI